MKVSGIYKIINKVNDHYYIGSSNDIQRRWYNHKIELSNQRHGNSHLQRAWNKYGDNNFAFLIVESSIPNDKLLSIEQIHLDRAREERDKCYNMGFIAGRIEMTESTRRKISESHKGKKNYNFGKPRLEETKQKIREKNKLWRPSEIQRKKQSDAVMGNKNHFFGKHHTNEARKKMSESHKGKPNLLIQDPTIFNFYNKFTNKSFVGTKNQLIKSYGLISTHVSAITKGKRNHHRGWIVIHS